MRLEEISPSSAPLAPGIQVKNHNKLQLVATLSSFCQFIRYERLSRSFKNHLKYIITSLAVYCDFTASGRGLTFLEEYISQEVGSQSLSEYQDDLHPFTKCGSSSLHPPSRCCLGMLTPTLQVLPWYANTHPPGAALEC